MLKDKPRKLECKFCGNVISYCKDKMFFHLGFDMMAMGELEFQHVQMHIHE
jgi:hypothetical protein